MTFDEVLDQVRALLQRRSRVTYRSLKLRFQLDEEMLEGVTEELIKAEQVAADEEGTVLVWTGDGEATTAQTTPQSQNQTPASYTPQHLADRILAEQAAMESRGASDGERKTITALFADLKGSTALIEGLDPEDARAIIDPALQLMMDAVHRYDGYVAQALGDGIFALFGAPIAHEDHPQRALYAALRMQEEMRRYSDQLRLSGGAPIQMRVGVNTGEVVVRSIRKDDLHTDYVPVGHSTNIAARMQQLANPGSIVVPEYTHRLTDGYFEFKALGETQVKGVEDPLNVYEVLGAGPLRTKLQVAVRRGLTRFVGRHSELDQMQGALGQAKAGQGQIVGVMGEPGVGKSRLFYEFKLTSQSGCLALEAFSISHGKASPYLPLIELLKDYFEITLEDDERKRREKVTGKVLTLDRSLENTIPSLFALLGIEEPDASFQQMNPQLRRQRTFEALKRLFLRESLNQPLMLIFEDLHWIDTETQGFLDMLSESVASTSILLLVNYRPEYRHEWGTKTYYTQFHLAPLGKDEAEELLTFLLGNDASLTALKRLILEKTDGTPFFMEEVVQTLAEEAVIVGERGRYRLDQAPTELHTSPTVQGVLAARIDRLEADEKALLQQLSVIGRQLPVSLVRQVVTQAEESVYRLLVSLQSKEFLYEQPAFPEVEYIFKHAFTQEVAYGSMLQGQRQALHARTAQALEELYRTNLDDHYSALAHHYREGGNTEKAVKYLGFTGQQDFQRSANVEAVNHLTTALDLLSTLPAAPARTQQELSLQATLSPALMATRGWSAPEVGEAFTRALELCRQVGEAPQRSAVLGGLWAFYVVRGELQTAREIGEQLLSLAQQTHDQDLHAEACFELGFNLLFRGESLLAREHLEKALTLYEPQQRPLRTAQYGYDSMAPAHIFLGQVLWSLGYPDQALKRVRAGLALALGLSHPYTQSTIHCMATIFYHFRRERQAVQEQAEAAVVLSTEQAFQYWATWGTIPLGWAIAEQGQREEGIAQIHQGLIDNRATGGELFRPWFLTLLAEAYGKDGQPEEGLRAVAEALKDGHKTGEHHLETELYRLKGELTLQLRVEGSEGEAEEWFQKAIGIARQQQAKSWELRAATSLTRLWQQQGKEEEARDLLSPVYNWFSEGFDTADLKDAKALLRALS